MRITLVTDWWPPRIGGVEAQASDLAARLAARGHRVRVLTTTRHPTAVPGVEVEPFGLPMTGAIAAPDLRRVVNGLDRAFWRAGPDDRSRHARPPDDRVHIVALRAWFGRSRATSWCGRFTRRHDACGNAACR
jgi:glycosyltransferase involved in cell wall biosynthesis